MLSKMVPWIPKRKKMRPCVTDMKTQKHFIKENACLHRNG